MPENEVTTRELVRIAMSTSIVHFSAALAVGYTAVSLGVLQAETTTLQFTLIFSSFWGVFGAAMVWKRERNYIQIHFLDEFARSVLGIDEASVKLTGWLDYIYVPTASVDLSSHVTR